MLIEEFTSNINLCNKSNNIIDDLAEAAYRIAFHSFHWRFGTLVIFNSIFWCKVEFLKILENSVIIGQSEFYPVFFNKPYQFIIFANNFQDIKQTLDWLRDNQFDNTGKYIIVCQSRGVNECDEFEAIQTFWDNKIINVVFLKFEGELAGYTYFPLYDENCSYNVPVKLNTLDIHAFEYNIFYEKLKNLNKCEIIVSTFIQIPFMSITNGKPEGADGDLLRLIGEKLNATVKVITPRIGFGWGKLEDNGTWSGSLADVYYDFANFSMTFAAITLARFTHFQISIDYNTINVVWVTHPALLKPSSLKLLHPFKPCTQLAIALSFAIVIIFALFTKTPLWVSLSKKIKMAENQTSIIFYSWMICMGLPTTKLPSKTTLLRIVIYWIWYCFLIRTIYQVCLISSLQGNFYYDQFISIADAINENYPYGGGPALKDYYIDNPKIQQNWINLEAPDIIPTLINVSRGHKFILAMNMETAKMFIGDNKISVHFLPERIVVSPTVLFFKKYSPLIKSVNKILRRLIESGFTDKYYKNHVRSDAYKITKNRKEAINLNHYTGCYFVLGFGWIVSSIIFMLELYFGKYTENL